MISKEIKNISNNYANSAQDTGYFCTCNDSGQMDGNLHSCRETFSSAWSFLTREYIIFNKTNINTEQNIERLNKFLAIIEKDKLKLKQLSVIYKTDLANAVVIQVAPFWRSNVTRRDIFTIFLRSSLKYQPQHNKKVVPAMIEYNLANATILAIIHFLKGNTVPTYAANQYGGFHNKFNNMKQIDLNVNLVKP